MTGTAKPQKNAHLRMGDGGVAKKTNRERDTHEGDGGVAVLWKPAAAACRGGGRGSIFFD